MFYIYSLFLLSIFIWNFYEEFLYIVIYNIHKYTKYIENNRD